MSKVKTQIEAPAKTTPAPVAETQTPAPRKAGGHTRHTPPLQAASDGAAHPARAIALMAAPARTRGAASRARMISSMQRAVGNTRVSRLIGPAIQTKLAVGEPDDIYEREADRVAETLTRQEPWPVAHTRRAMAQTAPRAAGSEKKVDADTEGRIRSPSGGQSLPESIRREMEPRLGADFSRVRVHNSSEDQADADRLNAKAFTHGDHIWLGSGASANDRKLMAHELTHVTQQRDAQLSLAPVIQRNLRELDEKLDKFDVPEDEVITLLGELTTTEKQTVLTGDTYRKLIARALNIGEMVRAVNNLAIDKENPTLAVKLEWVKAAAGSASDIDYPDIKSMVTLALPESRKALNTPAWREFFVAVCNDEKMIEAVNDLGFDLATKLEWLESEVFSVRLEIKYADIKGMVQSAKPEERDALKTDRWRKFFVKVCTDETMAEALIDLKWDLKTKLEWMRAEDPTAEPKQVNFTDSLPMTSYGDGPDANPVWESGDSKHAVAHVKGSNPKASAQFDVDKDVARAIVNPVFVRVKEGSNVRAVKGDLVVSKGIFSVPGLELGALTGSAGVQESKYKFQWEMSEDGTIWASLGETGEHVVYWLFDKPATSPLYSLAAAKATKYAAGASSAGAIANALRHGPRGVDGLSYNPADNINDDPLEVYGDGAGICTDYANLLTLLALSVGLTANTVMFWGGFLSLSKDIWVALGGRYGAINMVNVRGPVAAYNVPVMPISPLGWAFNYHAIARIRGALHDAALDAPGIEAEAAHAGKTVRLVEYGGAALPDAKAGTAYSQTIPRKDHLVDIAIRDYGSKITGSVFNTDVYVLEFPPAASSPYDVPVNWTLATGSLPPGLSLNSATGRISGTPTTPGTYSFRVKVAVPPPGGDLSNFITLTINVTP